MNRYVRAGRCPYCFGHGWLTNSDGDTWVCVDCVGTGTLAGLFDHFANQLNCKEDR